MGVVKKIGIGVGALLAALIIIGAIAGPQPQPKARLAVATSSKHTVLGDSSNASASPTPTATPKTTLNPTTAPTVKPAATPKPTPKPTVAAAYHTPTPIPATPAPANPSCYPNYSGACVPNVYPADVDCAGGSGNGPYYVQGPVQVIGADRYGLDSDHDGIACQ
jgi:hypothetical protein